MRYQERDTEEGVSVLKAHLDESGKELATRVTVAETLPRRLRGLLGRTELPAGEGLLIRPCKGIHTFFMKFPIDAVFLDKENRIVALFRDLAPNRMTPVYRKAYATLELPAGTLDPNTGVGDRVNFT